MRTVFFALAFACLVAAIIAIYATVIMAWNDWTRGEYTLGWTLSYGISLSIGLTVAMMIFATGAWLW